MFVTSSNTTDPTPEPQAQPVEFNSEQVASTVSVDPILPELQPEMPQQQPQITTPWWKLLLLTLLSAVANYALAAGLLQIRIDQPSWAAPLTKIADAENPGQTISDQITVSNLFYKWDSYYYVTIAQNGYDDVAFNTSKRYNWAFFPLYPTLLKLATSIPWLPQTTDSYLITGMLLSNIFLFASLLVWKRLANLLKLTQGNWNLFLIFLLLFPVSYVYHFVFTESLFLFLSSLALLWMAERKFLPAAWITGLAAATRVTGIFLVPLLLYSYYRENMKTEKNLADFAWLTGLSLISLTPLALFFNYLAALTGELLAPLKIQAAWNNDGFVPFSSFIGYFKDYGFTFHSDHGLSILLLCISWLLVIWSGYQLYSKRHTLTTTQLLMWLFTVALVFINSSVNSRSSIFRYTTTIPYLFVILGYFFNGKITRWLSPSVMGVFLLFHVVFLAFFLWQIPIYGF
jgi:Gpi18-like mannosyltransferase